MKVGMVAVWDRWARRFPATVLQLDNCQVVQVKKDETEGYTALQLGIGEAKLTHRYPWSKLGHFASKGLQRINRKLGEFRVTPDAILPVGTPIVARHFVPGQVKQPNKTNTAIPDLFLIPSSSALLSSSLIARRCLRHLQREGNSGCNASLEFPWWQCLSR